MPLGRKPEAGSNDYVHVNAPGWLVRRIEVLQGGVDVEIICRLSVDFAGRNAAFSRIGNDLVFEGEGSGPAPCFQSSTSWAQPSFPWSGRRLTEHSVTVFQ
jgi:hypothetical protein